MSRYFISVPEGPEGLRPRHCSTWLSCALPNYPPPSSPLSLSTPSLPEACSSLGGVYAGGPAPPLGLTGARAPVRLSISISGLGDWS